MPKLNGLFRLRGTLTATQQVAIEAVGFTCLLLLWQLVSLTDLIPRGILPAPFFGTPERPGVLTGFLALLHQGVIWHTFVSAKLNFGGYIEAVLVSVPLGFALGLVPLFGALSERLLASTRFLPLPAAMGVFIAAFGIGSNMKVQFLAVGIIVYLLPTVVDRVRQTPEVYVQTAKTLGASYWQMVRRVFFPDVMSRVSDDIRVLVAISWTYITISEVINSNEGGLGALAYNASHQGRVDEIYAILVLIMFIGWVQDWTLKWLDRVLFPFKYA